MDRKLKIKVLKNGPNNNSQEEIDCAAWLIKNNLADGDFVQDYTRTGGHAKNIIWRGSNNNGDKY